ncbi:MAG: hypothetical protein BWY82_01652 [Verrucomicrobia bacterium ADurb.Bin474]|nr:MAG: hypothetical protein BWY82_01652 [Verrucomicrobia bacterium ADurb.Bin474]
MNIRRAIGQGLLDDLVDEPDNRGILIFIVIPGWIPIIQRFESFVLQPCGPHPETLLDGACDHPGITQIPPRPPARNRHHPSGHSGVRCPPRHEINGFMTGVLLFPVFGRENRQAVVLVDHP